MSPPGLTATFDERRCSAAIPDQMIQDTVDVLEALGAPRSRSWVMRTIRAWQKSNIGLAFGDALLARLELSAEQRALAAASSELRYLLEYRDPTGETAARHVDRERGWR